ncbi:IclR family transcriptional regulator [Maritimibacter sp. 55A14]|uniref:HTH-type transcriptional regulator BhcR n=1 Tax=Maritimibacter sp. 55A14 TaxID=2174844 RepID=UPI000D6139A8|nr:HTH-type transcriptional regulator BhcR [Maritimibacter sp. 55A14]PWE33252.1 IclR family transcriptional regulator [Maritimibacter sp. 55A14]
MAERKRGRPRAFHDRTEQNTIRALDRAMTILEALSTSEGAALSELASRLDQSPATLYRVLITLQGHEIAELDEASQTWHVGPGAYRIGSAFLRRSSVVERARPVMRWLMEATGETANLGVARGAHVLFVSQVETHETIRAFFPPGTESPMHASGIGKALLAHFPQDRLDRLLARMALDRFTDHTLTGREALVADLRAIAARGYALDNEERTDGMRCVAAPIFDATGEPVAGISVSGPVSRMTPEAAARMGGEVREAARQVTASIGGITPAARPA